jgi:inorganic pyrophosphatase
VNVIDGGLSKRFMKTLFDSIPPRDAVTKLVNVIIDTPRGSRNKFKFDEQLGCFRLSRILPAGHSFPYDFGSIPGTRAADGDALDVLVVMDEPTFPGCLVSVRLIGVIAARQTAKGRTERNDRLVAVPQTPVNAPQIRQISELGRDRLDEIEHFFVSYNEAQGRRFKPFGRFGPKKAEELLRAGISAFKKPGRKIEIV